MSDAQANPVTIKRETGERFDVIVAALTAVATSVSFTLARGGAVVTPTAAKPKRFHGTVVLDSTRVGRDASRVADEMISHLTGLVGAKVKVTLEIEAHMPDGAPEQVVRTVTENGWTLNFKSQGFEKD